MHARYLLSLLIVSSTPAYSQNDERESPFAGIWHSEIEVYGLHAALEFEIHREPTGEWDGRWEMMEGASWSELERVHIEGATIEVDMTTAMKFIGVLSTNDKTMEGTLYIGGNERSLIFSKVEEWATRLPARIDDQGKPANTWVYKPPDVLDDGWPVTPLNEQELQDVRELFQKVVDGQFRGLDAALVARKGQLMLEEYFYFGDRDEIHSLQSVSKSVTSLIVGAAHDEGLINDLDRPVYDYFADRTDAVWVKEKHPITLKHALTMSAALDWDETSTLYTDSRNDNLRMNRSGDMYGYVLSRERAPDKQPGDKFEYTSGLSILLGGVLHEATGLRIDHYAEKTLFEKMGIKHYYWRVNSGQVHTGGGLYLRARDILKLGQLILDQGRWNGEQVISQRWIEDSTAFHLPQSDSTTGATVTNGGA